MKQGKWILCFRLQTTQNCLGSSQVPSFSKQRFVSQKNLKLSWMISIIWGFQIVGFWGFPQPLFEVFQNLKLNFPKIVVFPKSSILIGFSIIFTIHFGGTPIFANTQFKNLLSLSRGVGCNLYNIGYSQLQWISLPNIIIIIMTLSSPAKNSLIPWCWPPSLVTATTRIIPFLVGVSEKPSTVSGRDATPSWYPHLPIYLQLRRQEFVGQPQEFGRHGESEKSQGWITSDYHHLAIDTPHVEVPLKFTFEDLSLYKTRKKSSPFIDTHVKEPLLVNRKA